ncbi:hypothetical protein TrST_g8492 [Triparma strigata]|uniref:Uncharacterized protein n=1 Tax=Triparma strigata TaxID=1606541 RepID=A0A9W7EB76_9STRA|nr:hypothetical protein TrST_g8492 [Triparma strigata]
MSSATVGLLAFCLSCTSWAALTLRRNIILSTSSSSSISSSSLASLQSSNLLLAAVEKLTKELESNPSHHCFDASLWARIEGLPRKLPAHGIGGLKALSILEPIVLGGRARLDDPGFFAHMDPPANIESVAASLWQVGTNQNLLHPDVAPSARLLQKIVIKWLAEFFSCDGGHFTSGSTVANLTAIWAAREVKKIKRVVASKNSHNSVKKAADILGLDFVAVNDISADCSTLDLSDACLVLTAGTTSSGEIEPLERFGSAWVHCDAAWNGPMRLSRKHGMRLDGIEDCDSVVFSCHKWLFQPKGCGVVLWKNSEKAEEKIAYGAGYLATPTVGVGGSQPATVVPLLCTLLAWGQDGVAERIDRGVENARNLARLVSSDSRFELWTGNGGRGEEGVVLWRRRDVGMENDRDIAGRVRDRMKEEGAFVSLSGGGAKGWWFRSVAANDHIDVDYFWEAVVRAAAAV